MRLPRLLSRRHAVLPVLAVALALTGVSTSDAASTASRPGPKPTIVLVHGADADSSSWGGVMKRLQKDRYPVIGFANPLRSVSGDAAALEDLLDTIDGPVVLVGHSYGGMVISVAAAGDPDVKSLVFVDAQIPLPGETAAQLTNLYPGSEFGAALVARPFTLPGGGTGTDLYVDQAKYRDLFTGRRVSAADALVYAAVQRPITEAALNEPATAAAWQTIPSWVVIGAEDKAIPPAGQRFMAHRAHARVTEIPGAPHVSMLPFPKQVAAVIEAAAR